MRRQTILIACWCLLLAVSCRRSPQRYLEKANQYFDGGKYDDAALNYRKAIQKDAAFGEAFYRLGLTELKRKDFREAYAALTSAGQFLPGRADAQRALAQLAQPAYQRPKGPP